MNLQRLESKKRVVGFRERLTLHQKKKRKGKQKDDLGESLFLMFVDIPHCACTEFETGWNECVSRETRDEMRNCPGPRGGDFDA